MNRIRLAVVAAAIPLVALAGVANAQDRYPPSPTDGPRDDVSVLPSNQTNPDVEVLPSNEVNPPAADDDVNPAPAAAPLAATGADVALLGLSGLAAVTAGGGAVYAARRRKS